MSELTEETNEFITLIKNKEKLSDIQYYYVINKDNIDISANNDYIFRNACKNNNMELVKFLYPLKTWNLNVGQNEDCDIYRDAFWFCCESGYLEIAQWLVKVEPKYILDIDDDIFACVCMDGHLNVAQWLLKVNPNIDISVDNEWNFGWVCEMGHLEMAKWLLETKPDIDISADNDYAFQRACTNGELEVAQFLMEIKPEKYVITIENNKLIDYKVKIIITKTIQKNDIQKEIDKCSICQTYISNIYTPCSHLYCKDCITSWLGNNKSCPYCRNEISVDDIMMIV
jgi:hypothetical protein